MLTVTGGLPRHVVVGFDDGTLTMNLNLTGQRVVSLKIAKCHNGDGPGRYLFGRAPAARRPVARSEQKGVVLIVVTEVLEPVRMRPRWSDYRPSALAKPEAERLGT